METAYFKIPGRNEGYLQVLKQFRIEIPLATKDHYPNLECVVEGKLPNGIEKQLPIFGIAPYIESNYYGLNSGGRSIILSNGIDHLRFKGIDIEGSITRAVANSPINHINYITYVNEKTTNLKFNVDTLNKGKAYCLPAYGEKPFSFFIKSSVDNEKKASEIIGKEFENEGFFRPYTFKASITYPKIRFKGEECSTLLFSLPSAESDLRLEELNSFVFRHLRFASQEELVNIKDKLCCLLEDLTSWNGFSARIIHENQLAPTENSHQPQNYVICHVNKNNIGLSRVDHTSTVRYNKDIEAHRKTAIMDRNDHLFVGQIGFTLLYAISLSESVKLKPNNYTGYYDMAFKTMQNVNPNAIKDYNKYIKRLKTAFEKGYKNKEVKPVNKKDLTDLVYQINNVIIDNEKQKIIFRVNF